MIASIRFRGKYELGMSSSGYMDIDGKKISYKEVPFVRYKFDKYDDSDIDFIIENSKRFDRSTTLVEIQLEAGIEDFINKLRERMEKVAVFVYADIQDIDVISAVNDVDDFDYETCDALAELVEQCDVDRICLVDKTNILNYANADKLLEQYSDMTGMDKEDFAFCNSPLSLSEYGCLTAIKARELMAMYGSDSDDVPLPTANHQKGCCGCIQFIEINKDYKAPISKSTPVAKKKDNSEKSAKTKSKGLALGMYRF